MLEEYMFGLRARLWRETVRVLAATRSDRVMNAVVGVQKARAWVEDVQDGVLHFAALPTRQDVRRLQRQVDDLRLRVALIDQALTELERQNADRSGADRIRVD